MGNHFSVRQDRLFIKSRQGEAEPIPFLCSPNQSDGFAPEGIVLHDTAGRLEKGNSVQWFLDPKAHASAHLTLERDGSLTQQVPFNRRAWHAGKSEYEGRKNVNTFAFGIEIVNPGRCERCEDGRFKPWFHAVYEEGKDGLHFSFAETKAHGKGYWLDYSPAQIKTLILLCRVLKQAYRLRFITTHWEIAPGRKVDTNPLFPLEALRQEVFEKREKWF